MMFLKHFISRKHSLERAFPELPRPVKGMDVRSVSLFSDLHTYQQIAAAYNALLPDSATWAVQHLNPLLDLPEVREWTGRISTWKALAAEMGREIIVRIQHSISDYDASLIPRVAWGFCLEERLGMVTARDTNLVFISTGAFRNASLGLACQTSDSHINLETAQRVLERAGWRVRSFP